MDIDENVVIINESPAGPYIVKGEFKIINRMGNETVIRGINSLCRCGKSNDKPFCDGEHVKINFEIGENS